MAAQGARGPAQPARGVHDVAVPGYIRHIAGALQLPVEIVAEASEAGDLIALVLAAAATRSHAPAADHAVTLGMLVRHVGAGRLGDVWTARELVEWAECGPRTPDRREAAHALRQLCCVDPADELDPKVVGMQLAAATGTGPVVVAGLALIRQKARANTGRWAVVDVGNLGDRSPDLARQPCKHGDAPTGEPAC